jgi:uncharacterized phage protein (TIGR02218 family)
MRTIPEALAERLASGVTTLAHVWRVVRRDEAVFGFTDHDEPLTFDGLTCSPMTGVSAGAIEKSAALNTDSSSIVGALNADAITEEDLARGVWDGARVDLYRVDWTAPALRVHLFAGRIGEIRRGALAFEAELRGLQARLNVPVGRVYSRFCDADLGDARCAKDIEGSAFCGEGVVSEVLADGAFRVEGLEVFADAWFTRGRLIWDAGGEGEVAVHRLSGDGAVIELVDPPSVALEIGAAFVVYAGCDKRYATCRAKFANSANFRGFTHMPGNDAIQAGPTVNEPLDGSSRFS